ncbi:MAG: MFS transporter [SAR324 cluster bacterium]|nr:MFS transporter [SAR324 cluster bacterium]
MQNLRLPQYSFPIVMAAGSLVLLLVFGIRAGFGLFLKPISADLGWGREIFAMTIALQNLFWGAFQPLMGAVSDRYGSGRTLVLGGAAYTVGLLLMSQASSPVTLYLSGGLMIGLGLSGSGLAVVLGAVGRAASEEQRSLAMGIGTAAGSLGQFWIAPLGQFFISSYGWSTALILLSIFSLMIVPAAVALTGNNTTIKNPLRGQENQGFREALAEAFGHKGFLYLTAGFFVCGFHVVFIGTHLPAFLEDQGLDPKYGAWSLAFIGFFNVIGSFASGYLGGKFSKKYCLSLLYLSRALLFVAFILMPTTPASVLIFSAIIGLLWLSTVPLTTGIVSQVFGPKYFSTLFGIVFFSHQIGSFLGAWLGGYLYDTTGSYDAVWWISVALGLASAVLHYPINEQSLRTVPA